MKGNVYVKIRSGDLIKFTPFKFEDGPTVTKVVEVIYRGRYQYVRCIIPPVKWVPPEVLLIDICDIHEIL